GGSPDVVDVLGPVPTSASDGASWWVFRGRLEETLGQVELAVGSFEKALTLEPASREAHFRLGRALERLGRMDRAPVHLDEASQYSDRLKLARREHEQVRRGGLARDASLYERLGQVCYDAGLIPEGRAWFEEALALDSSRAAARDGLARTNQSPDSEPI